MPDDRECGKPGVLGSLEVSGSLQVANVVAAVT